VGWNTGFAGPAQVVSGSWFKVQSYSADQSVVLTRNPTYWSTPAKLNKLVFEIFSDDKQLVPALQNKEIDLLSPTTVNLSMVQTANQVPKSTKVTLPGLGFEHIDFNQGDPYLAKLKVRQAIAHGVNRQSIILRTVGQISKGTVPLGSRMLVPSQKGYQATAYAYDPGLSRKLLAQLGFKRGSDGYFQPNYGPQKGKDLTFTIQSTAGNSIRSQTEVLLQAQMKAVGIKINIQNYDASTFGNNLPSGSYQIAEFAWFATPFVSGNQPIYCSYTNTTMCGFNWTQSANAQVDASMSQGSAASSTASEVSDYNKADGILWKNMVTLPLYQTPAFFAWSNNLKGVVPNTSAVGVTWNAQDWRITS
jgi:peptide/nickel transport system substrate-binding protein